jgi:hypothetical protein
MSTTKVSDVKHICDIVGELGKWQLIFVAFSTMKKSAGAISNMGYSFHAYSNDFWCKDVPIDYQVSTVYLIIHIMDTNKFDQEQNRFDEMFQIHESQRELH